MAKKPEPFPRVDNHYRYRDAKSSNLVVSWTTLFRPLLRAPLQ